MKLQGFLIAMVLGLLVATDVAGVADRPPKKKKADPVPDEARKLEGTWELVALELNGRQVNNPNLIAKLGSPRLVIKDGKMTGTLESQTTTIPLKIDASKKPREIDLTQQRLSGNGAALAVYDLNGDTLKVGLNRAGMKRPTGFTRQEGAFYVMVWRRIKK